MLFYEEVHFFTLYSLQTEKMKDKFMMRTEWAEQKLLKFQLNP